MLKSRLHSLVDEFQIRLDGSGSFIYLFIYLKVARYSTNTKKTCRHTKFDVLTVTNISNVGCNDVYACTYIPTFQRNLLLPFVYL